MQRNILTVHPEEYVTFPINGEPYLTQNYTSIQQNWSKNAMLYQVLDCNGDLKCFEDIILINCQIKMEYDAMKSALEGKVGHLKTYFDKLLLGIRPILGIFNEYGRIIFLKRVVHTTIG